MVEGVLQCVSKHFGPKVGSNSITNYYSKSHKPDESARSLPGTQMATEEHAGDDGIWMMYGATYCV